MPFLLRFCAAIRDWGARNNCQSQKSCNSDRFFVSGFLGGPPEAVLGCYGLDAERGWIWRGVGLTRCSARVLLGRGAWVLSGYRAKVLSGCGIVMLPHCRARELFGRGVVMRSERGVAKHGRCRGFGRLLVYRVVLLLSLKISNATLLKLVFRYNGRRGFVEEQARSPL